jgi:hypothetical protein
LVYDLYAFNKAKGCEPISVLPERRKDPLRITQESIVKWGQLVAGDSVDIHNMYFIQIEI